MSCFHKEYVIIGPHIVLLNDSPNTGGFTRKAKTLLCILNAPIPFYKEAAVFQDKSDYPACPSEI